ncbi:MAG: hypothetical protein ABIR54_22615 [Burkholderiaceae bacterium]
MSRLLPAARPGAACAMNLHDYDAWLTPLASALGAILVGIVAYLGVRPIARRASRHAPVASAVNRRLDKPLRWLLPLIAVQVAFEGAPDNLLHIDGVRQLITVLLIGAFTATAIAAVRPSSRCTRRTWPTTSRRVACSRRRACSRASRSPSRCLPARPSS